MYSEEPIERQIKENLIATEYVIWALQVVLVEEMPATAGDVRHGFNHWIRKIPEEEKQQPTAVFCLENLWTEGPGGLQSIAS